MFTMEITRLIERCRQGDADALGELYKAYAQRMRGVCRRYVSDEQTISDVLHDSFVIIFTSFDKLRDDRKAEAWMMSITRNVASKYKDHLEKMTFVQLEDAEQLQAPEVENEVRGVPLEDVKQALKVVRDHERDWGVDKRKVGIMGSSAGGHLASTAATHLSSAEGPNFQILLYPVISMDQSITHRGSRENLIGKNPTEMVVKAARINVVILFMITLQS